MSRIVVIGGSGHVGSYLVPALVQRGHEVVNVSRGAAKPYRPHFAWSLIENVTLDRGAEEKAGRFGAKIAELRPDIVVDMISFDLAKHAASGGGAARQDRALSLLQFDLGVRPPVYGPFD